MSLIFHFISFLCVRGVQVSAVGSVLLAVAPGPRQLQRNVQRAAVAPGQSAAVAPGQRAAVATCRYRGPLQRQGIERRCSARVEGCCSKASYARAKVGISYVHFHEAIIKALKTRKNYKLFKHFISVYMLIAIEILFFFSNTYFR